MVPGRDIPHTRRRLLAGAASGLAAATVAALPAVAGTGGVHPPVTDPHPGWAAEVDRLIGLCQREDIEDDELDVLIEPLSALEDRICLTPACTLAGVREQLAFLHRTIRHNQPDERERTALANALATIDLLAGRAAA